MSGAMLGFPDIGTDTIRISQAAGKDDVMKSGAPKAVKTVLGEIHPEQYRPHDPQERL